MDFSIKACDWSEGEANGFLTGKSDVIVLGIFEAQSLTGAARDMDVATKGLISRIVKAGDMSGRAGTTLLVPEVTGIGASRVLLVGLGKQDAFTQKAYGEAVRAAWRVLLGAKIGQATFTLAQLPIQERDDVAQEQERDQAPGDLVVCRLLELRGDGSQRSLLLLCFSWRARVM